MKDLEKLSLLYICKKHIMDNSALKVTLIQMDIIWEDKKANLEKVHGFIQTLSGQTDLFVLPEMFSTGFTMDSHIFAETNDGETITLLKSWAKQYNVAIAGSFITKEGGKFYNRGFFLTPDDEFYYDKRHLFRMGGEEKFFSAGEKRLVFEHKGYRICFLICYDLRFPVWARNIENEYDLLLYVANWPTSRIKVWDTLVRARAIENMCYVCAVNRVGTDGNRIAYNGESKMIDAKGNILASLDDGEKCETVTISKKELTDFRIKFPVWKDADKFTLT